MQERRTLAALTGRRHLALLVTVCVAAAVIAADQAITSWALADLRHPVHLIGPLGLALEFNSGTAFSLFAGAGDWLIPVVVVLVAAVGWLAWRTRRALFAVAYGLVLGGALGNLSDRLFRGHHGDVVDFVTLSHWPTFNVADACITVGVILLIAGLLFPHGRTPPSRPAQGRPEGDRRRPGDEVDAHGAPGARTW